MQDVGTGADGAGANAAAGSEGNADEKTPIIAGAAAGGGLFVLLAVILLTTRRGSASGHGVDAGATVVVNSKMEASVTDASIRESLEPSGAASNAAVGTRAAAALPPLPSARTWQERRESRNFHASFQNATYGNPYTTEYDPSLYSTIADAAVSALAKRNSCSSGSAESSRPALYAEADSGFNAHATTSAPLLAARSGADNATPAANDYEGVSSWVARPTRNSQQTSYAGSMVKYTYSVGNKVGLQSPAYGDPTEAKFPAADYEYSEAVVNEDSRIRSSKEHQELLASVWGGSGM